MRITNGGTIDVSLTISLLRDAAGRIIGASKIVRDITERKAAEARLRESEERLHFIAERAQVGTGTENCDRSARVVADL